MNYRKYDPMVKKLIIESRNRNLFPELNIPRTTINYWLDHSKEQATTDKISTYDAALKNIDRELYKEKAKSFILKECMKHTFKNSEFYDYKSKKTRKFIINLIEDYKEILVIKEILICLGLSNSTYYRWRSEILGCRYNGNKKCSVSKPSQLTMEEQRKLVKFAKSKQFKKFSTVSLMYYCKRKNLLNCSLESWYKYLRLYGIDRRNKKFKKITYRNGLRAKSVDEYWHIDITGVNKRAYLQIVVDNYSRKIVGWKLSLNKKMELTYKTLIKSFNVSPEFQGNIISDKGAENTGKIPVKLLLGRGIRQLLFKFVHQYNNVIPHTMLLGATPGEAYKGEFDRDLFIKNFKANKLDALNSRRASFKKCQKCYKKHWGQS